MMIRLDGSQHSGSGTLVRFAVALAGLRGVPLRMFNVRAARDKPGLRRQHLTAVRACAELCGGTVEGAVVGAREFSFLPGSRIRGGRYAWDIGSAGSATMLALAVLPLACFADGPVHAHITGGLFQDFAPSPYHLRHVLMPVVERMGVVAALHVIRPGYVPGGGGVLELRVQPCRQPLRALELMEAGTVGELHGIALSSHLQDRRVSERMAQTCEERLRSGGFDCHIEWRHDSEARQPGAGLAVWARTSTGCRFGADRAGALRRRAETIGRSVAEDLIADVRSGATVDRHAADQLVLFAALASGTSRYRVPGVTDHVRSNLWLVERFGARAHLGERIVSVVGLGQVRAKRQG
jgi:RNA 3'-terminal phosphate cyclase (ATP)